jgi:hypothetical protein
MRPRPDGYDAVVYRPLRNSEFMRKSFYAMALRSSLDVGNVPDKYERPLGICQLGRLAGSTSLHRHNGGLARHHRSDLGPA